MKKVLMGVALVAAGGVAVAGGDDCWGKSKTMDAQAPATEKAVQAEASKAVKPTAEKKAAVAATASKRDEATKTAAAKKPQGT